MRKTKDALLALSGQSPKLALWHCIVHTACLELGYQDFKVLRTDEDLAFVRTDPRFEAKQTCTAHSIHEKYFAGIAVSL